MSNQITHAKSYLLPLVPSFWQWQDQGDVITWKDGETIAFRAELYPILERLAPLSLPPLSPLLLVLAASRDSWETLPAQIDVAEALDPTGDHYRATMAALFDDTTGLGKLRQLPSELRSSPEAKGVLAEVIFEGFQPTLPPEQAPAVLQFLKFGMEEVLFWSPESSGDSAKTKAQTQAQALADLGTLQRHLNRVVPEALRLRRKTSLDQLPQAAEVEVSQAQQVRSLLAELRQDDELQGLSRLTQTLMAAISLPRTVSDTDELQLGGVSDITNRGPLDRLLLTELSHDDLTLAVRISQNEALYIRRESPPKTPQRQRALLLDSGIRSWGVPRVFATAVALAVVATTDARTHVSTFRAEGDRVVPVDLLSRDGLIAHLECLRVEAHPGKALPAFLDEMATWDQVAEPVLVTTDDVLADEAFCEALAQANFTSAHIASVNREGDFQLSEKTVRGTRLVRAAQLDLEAILPPEPTRAAVDLIDREWAKDLPAIFSVEPFPLLLSAQVATINLIPVPDDGGVLAFTKDRRLLHWHERRTLGAMQITDQLPQGQLHGDPYFPHDRAVRAVLRTHRGGSKYLLKIDLEKSTCESLPLLTHEDAKVISGHNGVLFALRGQTVQMLSAESGELMDELSIPQTLTWKRGRFFRNTLEGHFYTVGYDGATIRLEKVPEPRGNPRLVIDSYFECREIEGPLGITGSGALWSTLSGEVSRIDHQLQPPITVLATSQDGRRIVLGQENHVRTPPHFRLVDVVNGDMQWVGTRDLFHSLHPDAARYVTPNSMRHRFSGIAVVQTTTGETALVLRSRKKDLAILLGSLGGHILLKSVPFKAELSQLERSFKEVKVPEIGYSLSVATWEDGSQAFLDGRGLLHLRSSKREIPEVTIVLTDGFLAGWCSDGRLWGRKYFSDQTEDQAFQHDVYHNVILAFLREVR